MPDKRRTPMREDRCAIAKCNHPPVMGFYDYRLCQVHVDRYLESSEATAKLKKILRIVDPPKQEKPSEECYDLDELEKEMFPEERRYDMPKAKAEELRVLKDLQDKEEKEIEKLFPEKPTEDPHANGSQVAMPDALGHDGTPPEGK